MHAAFEKAENFEALLMSEINTAPAMPMPHSGEDAFDAGQRLVNAISDDLSLDMLILDIDGIQ